MSGDIINQHAPRIKGDGPRPGLSPRRAIEEGYAEQEPNRDRWEMDELDLRSESRYFHDEYLDWCHRDLDCRLRELWQEVVCTGNRGQLWRASFLRSSWGGRTVTPEALLSHLRLATSVMNGAELLELEPLEQALDGVRFAQHRFPEFYQWLRLHPRLGAVVLYLAPFWRQSPENWQPPHEALSLANHLFAEYPVPEPLGRAWSGGRYHLKWMLWFVLLGRGVSLKKAARLFGWIVVGHFSRHFLSAPGHLDPLRACMWAEVGRLGGGAQDFDRLERAQAFSMDPTDELVDEVYLPPIRERYRDPMSCEKPAELDFWRQTVGWLADHREQLNDEMAQVILEWAVHRHTESRREGQTFSWGQLRPQLALERANAYRQGLSRPYLELDWASKGWDWEFETPAGWWSIRELTSAGELYEEGLNMKHCVVHYAHTCWRGHSAIFSLRFGDCRRLTVEVSLASGRIVQAGGERNRRPQPEESRVLELWWWESQKQLQGPRAR